MAEDLSALGDLVIQVGADISPLRDTLNQIPEATQQASQAFDAFMAQGLPATEALAAATGQVAQAAADAGNAASSAATPMADLAGATSNAGASISDLVPKLNDTRDATQQVSDETASLAEQFRQIVALAGVAATVDAFAMSALNAYAAIQKTEISMTALTGSAGLAAQTINQLKEVALSDALAFPQLVQAQTRMMALGIASVQIPGLLQAAANSAAVMGTSFETAVNQIDRMSTSGTVMARSLANLGLSTEDLAKVMGVATDQVTATFKALDQSERVNVLTEALAKFGGVAQEQAQGIAGQFQNLKTQFTFLLEDIGSALAPVVSQFLSWITSDVIPFLHSLVDGFNALPTPIKDATVALVAAAAALAAIGASLKVVGLAFPEMIAAAGGLAGILPIIAAIGAAVVLIHFSGIVDSFKGMVSEFTSFFPEIGTLVSTFADGIKTLSGWFLDAAKDSTSLTSMNIKDWINGLLGPLGAVNQAMEAFTQLIIGVSGHSSQMDDALKGHQGVLEKLQAANTKLNETMGQTGQAFTSQHTPINQIAADYNTLQKNLNDAEANLQKVAVALKDGQASQGQYAAALKAVEQAQLALNPSFVTAADYQRLLADAAKQQEAAEKVLAETLKAQFQPAILDVATAERNLLDARDAQRQAGINLQLAEANLNGIRLAAHPSVTALTVAENALDDAKKAAQAANLQVTEAEKNLTASRKESAEELKLTTAAQAAYTAGQEALAPIQKTVAATTAELSAARKQLATDLQSLMAIDREYNALPNNDPAKSKAAQDLSAATKQVETDKKALTQTQKDLTTAEQLDLQVTQLMLTVGKDTDTLQKDRLLPTTVSLTQALANLKAAKDAVLEAYQKEQAALQALTALQQAGQQGTEQYRQAVDNLKTAHTELTTAESKVQSQESIVQQEFGVSKTAADVLTGSLVNVGDAYKDLGVKSVTSLQAQADASKTEFQIIADSGTASAETLREAWIKSLEDQKAALRAAGGDLDSTEQATLRKLLEDQDYYNQQSIDRWYQLYQQIDSQVISGLQNITKVFTGALFGGIDNSALKGQIADVQQKMQDATAAFQQAQTDAAAKLKQLETDNANALAAALDTLKNNLDARTVAYNQFVQDAKNKLAELKTAEQEKLASQVATLQDNLQKQIDSYNQYQQQVMEKIAALTAAEQANLAQTLDKLKASLDARTAAYNAYVQGIQQKIDDVRRKEQDNIDADTIKTNDAIKTKTDAYDASKQKILDQIAQLEKAGVSSTSPQVEKLQADLAAQTKAYDDFVQTQQDALASYVKSQQDAADAAVSAYQDQLDAQTAAYQTFVAQNQQQQEDATDKAQAQLDKQVAALKDSLSQREAKLEQYRKDTFTKIEEVTQKDQEEFHKQEMQLLDSVDKQTASYDAYKQSIEQKMADTTTKYKDQLAAQEEALQASLDKQAAAYKKTMDGFNQQIEDLKGKFKTVWSELGDAVLKSAQGMLDSMANAFLKPAEDAIAHFIAGGIANLLGKLGLGGISDALGNLGSESSTVIKNMVSGFDQVDTAVATASSDLKTMASDMANVNQEVGSVSASGASGAGGVGGVGGIGGGLGTAASGVMGIVNMVTGIISAVTGVISIFQNMHQEDTLRSIEHNTRYTMMYVGERSDGGILGQMFKLVDVMQYGEMEKNSILMANDIELVAKPFWAYGLGDLDSIKMSLWQVVGDLDAMRSASNPGAGQSYLVADLDSIKETGWKMLADLDYMKNPNSKESWAVADLDEIKNNTYYTAVKLDAIIGLLSGTGIITKGSGAGADTTSLAAFITANFTALDNWLSPMFRSLLAPMGGFALAAVPTLPVFAAAPAMGMPGSTTVNVTTNFNGTVVGGQQGMKQVSEMVHNNLVDSLRRAGLKFQ